MNTTKLKNDYELLENNEFWKHYQERIGSYSKARLDMLKSFPIEKVAHLQGEIAALDWVISLPGVLLETLIAGPKSKEV